MDGVVWTWRTPLSDGGNKFNPPGRAVMVRNTNQEDSKDKAHWYVASVPAILSSQPIYTQMAIVELEVDRDPTTGSTGVCMRQMLRKQLPAACTTIQCDASNYDISEEAQTDTTVDTGVVTALLEYSKLRLGDALPDEKRISFPAGTYLPSSTPYKFLNADEWGEDMDVRRLILQSGSLCGSGIWSNHCVSMGKAIVDSTFTPTKTEKRWIFSVQSGRGGIKNVKVGCLWEGRGGGTKPYTLHRRDLHSVSLHDSTTICHQGPTSPFFCL